MIDDFGHKFLEALHRWLHPKVVISNARDFERANRILEKAEKYCLIPNSIKSMFGEKLEGHITICPTLTLQVS